MGSFNFHELKAEKVSAVNKHRQIRKIAKLFRYIELCVVLVLISRLSFQLPVFVKNSREYLRSFSISPCFVFFLGNVIIITLFAQSGPFSAHGSKRDNPDTEFYHEFIQNSTKYQIIQEEQKKYQAKQSIGKEYSENQSMKPEDSKKSQIININLIKHPEKQSIGTEYPKKQSLKTEDSTKSRRINSNIIKHPEKQSDGKKYPENQRIKAEDIKKSEGINSNHIKCPQKQSMKRITKTEDRIKCPEKQSKKTGDRTIVLEVKDYRRCQSEIVSHVQSENPCRVLKRCDTEMSIENAERVGITSYPEDGMSNYDFRRTIEAFIARQQRLRKQEQCFAPRI